MKLEDHPTVQRVRLKTVPSVPSKKESLDAGRLKQLHEQAGDRREQAIGALRERLQHEAVAVAIDDERREEIGLTVHEPAGAGIDVQGLPVGNRRLEPRAPGVHGRRILIASRRDWSGKVSCRSDQDQMIRCGHDLSRTAANCP